MLTNILRLAHSIVIGVIIYHILLGCHLNPIFFLADIFFIFARAVIEKQLTSRKTRFQILFTMSLGYIIFPNRLRYIGWLYLFNAIELYKSLKAMRATCTLFSGSENKRYIAFVFDFLRFGICQYIFLGIIMMVYKYIADQKEQALPENYVILYQLIVTATTIGYGDVTPKSEFQMIFFTYTVPLICGSFVIYTNNIVDLYMNTFFAEEPSKKPEEQLPIEEIKQKTD